MLRLFPYKLTHDKEFAPNTIISIFRTNPRNRDSSAAKYKLFFLSFVFCKSNSPSFLLIFHLSE